MAKKRRSEAETVTTTIRLKRDLHENARIHAVRSKTSLQALVNQALADYLKRK